MNAMSPSQPGWVRYDEARPVEKGIYRWRVPSVIIKGLIVTFNAKFRERGAGHTSVLSPEFDHWDGWKVIVPPLTEWRPVDTDALPDHRYECLDIEGITNLPCPFCKGSPRWNAVQASSGGGVVIASDAHRYNRWWLECCSWALTPRYGDPRTLANDRNGMLARLPNNIAERGLA
jgi:hypothetical protein